jgi:putative transposase
MKQIMNAYTAYFNKRYDRVGHLMQGVFKAAEITTDEQLVQVCRYIHVNPLIAGLVTNLQEYRWSNYIQYVDNKDGAFCDKDIILSLFPSSKAYEQFTLDQIDYQKNLDYIDALILD